MGNNFIFFTKIKIVVLLNQYFDSVLQIALYEQEFGKTSGFCLFSAGFSQFFRGFQDIQVFHNSIDKVGVICFILLII